MDTDRSPPLLRTRTTFLLAIVIWSAVVLLSLWMQRGQLDKTAEALAKIDALANLRKDMAIRKWAASVGGIFINEDRTPELGTLQEQERLSGTKANGEPFKLIALTPIHVVQYIQAINFQEFGVKERLTSQQLRNLDNAPDDWEAKALKSLQGGSDVAAETVQGKKGHGLLRVMLPMRMEEECLECHRDTLVPVGGLRGGAVISVDLNAYRTAQEPTWRSIQYWHAVIWLMGLATLTTFRFFGHRRMLEAARRDEERRENELAFSAMAEGAVITDADGTILWVNNAFCRIFGYTREEAIGKTPRILKSGRHSAAEYETFWHQLKTVGHWRGELWNKRKSGEVFPEEISIQALRGPDGRIRRFISIFSDITERKRTDEELQKHRMHLEDLVRQRTEEVTVARDQAEAANRSKSAFLANMSHELRTPLNAVIGFSQLIERDPTLSETQRRNVETINSSGNHLLTLIDDILELSKIESGRMEVVLNEVDVTDLLHRVTDMMRVRAEQAGLFLVLDAPDAPLPVLLDAVKLRQVLLNLLSNAVKFTPEGEVVLILRTAPAQPGHVRLEFAVRDSGIGIAPADQERIFHPFEQTTPGAQRGGTGLGLTISRQYVQMMGGELSVESAPGRGSCFRFALTVAASDALPAGHHRGPVVAVAAEDRGRRILVVDDVAETRLLVRSLLEPLGFAIAEAADGIEAEEQAAAFRPELLFMDWRMPRRDGIAAMKQIRARHDIPQPTIIMLTANALDESRQEALAAGADDFMSKPYQHEDLYALLERHLGVHFERQGAQQMQAENALDPADLDSLPAPIRAKLSQAVLSLNHERITAALDEVAQEQPRLAARLRQVAEAADYHLLWRALGIAGLD